MSVVRQKGLRTTHVSPSATVCYIFHPLHGQEVEPLHRHPRSGGVTVRLSDDSLWVLPGWMLDPVACSEIRIAAEPVISLQALHELRQLLDAQPLRSSRPINKTSSSESHFQGGKDGREPEKAVTAALAKRCALETLPRGEQATLSSAAEAAPEEGPPGQPAIQERGQR